MLDYLKKQVLKANLELVKQGLVIYTWGNASGRDPETGYIVIKPSGVAYDHMKADDMVVVDIEGKVLEGCYRPSSDTTTHLEIYKSEPSILGVVHTHSEWATAWAQAGQDIPCYGTTHADYFYGCIPCTRPLTQQEVEIEYEQNTGKVIVETFQRRGYNINEVPGIIVSGHGPFTWGNSALEAVHNAKVLDEISKLAFRTQLIDKNIVSISQFLQDKHYLRKHGSNAYYGQK